MRISTNQPFGMFIALLVSAVPALALAEPPSAADQAAAEPAAEHVRKAREHALAAAKQGEAEVRDGLDHLHQAARSQAEVVREDLKQAGSVVREHLQVVGLQLKAAGEAASEQLSERARQGLADGKVELKLATEQLRQGWQELRRRAERARARAWARWKTKLESRDAIDASMQREFDKHARRDAKLQRIAELARKAGDDGAVARVYKLRALEAKRHDERMQELTSRALKAVDSDSQEQP